MLISVKMSLNFSYPELRDLWHNADLLGFHGIWDYDHFYGPLQHTDPTFEGWTTLAAMAVVVQRARVGCMVSGVTYRNPAVLAKMAVTVDHVSGGRLEFGIGAGWHEAEHRGYGIAFPSPGTRVAMVDEALTVIRRLWAEDSVTFSGRFFTLEEALCAPKPLQKPHPPIVIGASKPRMLRVVARHADEWNMPAHEGPGKWGEVNSELDEACGDVGRDPAEIRRSAQLALHPARAGDVDQKLALLDEFAAQGCQHMVLAFREPPGIELLQVCAELNKVR